MQLWEVDYALVAIRMRITAAGDTRHGAESAQEIK